MISRMDSVGRLARLRQVEEQRTALEVYKKDLLKQLAEVHRAIYQNERDKAACAPIHALPDDILKLVFEEAYEHKLHKDCPRTSLLVVTHVSQRWRQVAVCLPKLWRCIHVHPSTSLVELCVRRAGAIPLFINFCDFEHETPENRVPRTTSGDDSWTVPYLRGLEFLLKHASRIQYINLQTISHRLLIELLPMMQKAPMPLLQHMEIFYEGSPSNLPNKFCFDLQFPELKRLYVMNLLIPFSSAFFQNLQELSFDFVEFRTEELCALADAAPQLKTLRLDRAWGLSPDLGLAGPFPCLESLTVITHSDHEAYLDCFDAPALFCLTIKRNHMHQWHSDMLSHLRTSRAFPSVRHLRLHDTFPKDDDDEELYGDDLFRYAPNTTTLELYQAVYALEDLLTTPVPLPFLDTLVVADLPDDNHADLLEVVEHRARCGCPLKELRLWERVFNCINMELLKELEDHVRVSVVADELDEW